MLALLADFLGWSSWNEWSACSNDGIRLRHRRCLVEQPGPHECRGAEFEKTACVPGDCDGKSTHAPHLTYVFNIHCLAELQSASSATVPIVICCCMLLTVACCLVTFHFTKRRYLQNIEETLNKTTTTTASFDTYPNQYSSLPTKDVSDAFFWPITVDINFVLAFAFAVL